jgi:hypothetical protein
MQHHIQQALLFLYDAAALTATVPMWSLVKSVIIACLGITWLTQLSGGV